MDKLEKLYKNANYTAVFVDYNNILLMQKILSSNLIRNQKEKVREKK